LTSRASRNFKLHAMLTPGCLAKGKGDLQDMELRNRHPGLPVSQVT
jgi:hypothetical protein